MKNIEYAATLFLILIGCLFNQSLFAFNTVELMPPCSGNAATVVFNSSVFNADNATGVADGTSATFGNLNASFVLDLGNTLAAGENYVITWRTSSNGGTSLVRVEESSDGAIWLANGNSNPHSETGNTLNDNTFTTEGITRYLRLTLISGSNSALSVDAVTYTGQDCCTLATFTNVATTQGTCNGSIANTDAGFTITGISAGDRADISTAGSVYYNGDEYADAETILGGAISFSGLSQQKIYKVRIYDGATGCYTDVDLATPASPAGCPSSPADLPWAGALCNGSEILLKSGVAAITCGTTFDILNPNERYTFGLVDFEGALASTTGRQDITTKQGVWHHPDWTVEDIGLVYGIAINSNTGDMFTVASSNYASGFGVSVSQVTVLRYGDIGGGESSLAAAGTVYKMDATTGAPTVFAVLPQQLTSYTAIDCEKNTDEPRDNTGVGLGNIVYDEIHKQYFVTNIEDGRIYRLDLDGNILDSYDPGVEDDGVAGISDIEDLAYGLAVEPNGNRLFYGNIDTPNGGGNAGVGAVMLFSIDLNADGSFAGAVDNSTLPAGATYSNYRGTETVHATIPVGGANGNTFTTNSTYQLADLSFTPSGDILAGIRVGCQNSFFTSYNHWGTTNLISLGGGGLYSTVQEYNISAPGQAGPEDSYGGVAAYELQDGSGAVHYLTTSADVLEEVGPHGITIMNATATPGSATEITPLGVVSYGTIDTGDPKGVGGDVEVFSKCLECELMIVSNTQSNCNDNGTPSDPSDDYFTIDINATAENGGTQFEVVQGANADGTGGTVLAMADYGTTVTVGNATIFDANGVATYDLTIRDNMFASCNELITTTAVASCSDLCVLTITQNTVSTCNDNGTPSDPSDDYFTIDVNATALNASTQYEVVLGANADGTGGIILGSANYGSAITVGDATTFDANGFSTYNLTVRAQGEPTCHEDFTTNIVESCSPICALTITQSTESTCNDNGTPSDPSDDYFTIDVNATALNASTQYEVVLGANADGTGGTVLATSNYGTAVTVGNATTFGADGTTTYTLTVRDSGDATCHDELTTTPVMSCSDLCALTITTNVESTCNDNGTPSDSSDDYFTVEVNATALQGSAQYEVVLGANADGTGGTVLATSNYGTAITVGDATTFDADGTTTYTLTVRDAGDATCHDEFTTNPVASCSNTCVVTITTNTQSTCNDNGTPSDPSDDYFTVEVNATGLLGSTQYEVVLGANADGTGGTLLATSNYGTAITVGDATTFDADGATTYTLTVRDSGDATCHDEFTTNPVASCSNTCVVTITTNTQSTCNDNGTPSDPSDDYFTVEVNATGLLGSTQYEVVLGANADGTGGTVLATSNYGTAVTVGDATTFDADGTTTYTLTVRDSGDATCHDELTTTPVMSCSDLCALTITTNVESTCNDNGTPSDPSDDYFTIDVNATALNGNAQYEVVLGANADGTGGTLLATSNYGTEVTIGNATTFDADGTSTYVITVRDAVEDACHDEFTTNPIESCSDLCVMTITSMVQLDCNTNGTPTNDMDDYYTLSVNASAIQPGAQNQFEVLVDGVSVGTSTYGTALIIGNGTNGATGILSANGVAIHMITVRDIDTNTCSDSFTTSIVEPCSNCPDPTCPPVMIQINSAGN